MYRAIFNVQAELEYFKMSCAKNEIGVKNHTCSITGEVYYLECLGKKGQRDYTCGAKTVSLCSIWTGKPTQARVLQELTLDREPL